MTSITENAHGLARYAQLAQMNGLVPIVEPEVTLGPGTYTIEETAFWCVVQPVHIHMNPALYFRIRTVGNPSGTACNSNSCKDTA